MSFFKGWRTRLFSVAVFALGLLQVLDPNMLFSVLPDAYKGWVFIVIAVATYLLRQITTTPPGKAS